MQEVLREALNLIDKGERFVLATVVRTKGSTPQKLGARLVVRRDGSAVGTLGGGCVEGDIWFAAKQLLSSGAGPEYKSYYLNESIAAREGLVCGGTMYFLIDPIYYPEEFQTFAKELVEADKGGRPVVLATVVKPSSSKLSKGSKLMLREDGSLVGSLGDSSLDGQAVDIGVCIIGNDTEQWVVAKDGTELFLEAHTAPPALVLMGGGHVAKAIAPVAKSLGFRIFIVDDRPQFANLERFPEAEAVAVADYSSGLDNFPIYPNTAILVVTRGHQYDDLALEGAARTRAGYVGLMGSKRKTLLIYEALLKRGITLERIKNIHSPVGLDIGARDPAEIAVSIMGEVLQWRLGGTAQSMKLDDGQIMRIYRKVQRTLHTPSAV